MKKNQRKIFTHDMMEKTAPKSFGFFIPAILLCRRGGYTGVLNDEKTSQREKIQQTHKTHKN